MYYGFKHFKYKLALLFFIIALIASLILGVFHYINTESHMEDTFKSYRVLIKNNILTSVTETDQLYLAIEKMLDPTAKKILLQVSSDYNTTKQLNSDLKSYVVNNPKFNLFIINDKNKIIKTTEIRDLGLDFNKYPSFAKELESIRNNGNYYSKRMTGSVNFSDIRKYCYLPSKDGKYIFELGYKISDYMAYINGIGFENIEKKLINVNDSLYRVLIYNSDGNSIKKNQQNHSYQIKDENLKHFSNALITMKSVEFNSYIGKTKVIIQYIPYRLKDSVDSEYIKIIEVIYKYDWLDKQMAKNLEILIVLFLATTFVSIILGIYLSKIVSKPIEQIVVATQEFSTGNYDYRTLLKSRDEFKTLNDSINKMAESIKIRENDLNDKNCEILQKNQEIHALYEQAAAMNDSLEEYVIQNNKNYIEVVSTICSAIEAKDSYTRGHSERVKDISIAIAEEMHLSREEMKLLESGSILHDVGKIGIPEDILNKTTRLDSNEYELVKNHPVIGHEILKDVHFLKDGLEIVIQHHERYDGLGYPMGLKGEEINLLARIVCVADAYDAMTSSRSYRKVPLTLEQAASEISQNSGTQFDPVIAEICLKCIRENQLAFQQNLPPNEK